MWLLLFGAIISIVLCWPVVTCSCLCHKIVMESKKSQLNDREYFGSVIERKLEECRSELKGFPSLISRSFETVSHEQPPTTDFDEKEIQRKQHSNDSPTQDVAKNCFKVLQYNILADALGTEAGNFDKVPKDCLPWKFRKNRIFEQILVLNQDVICLEEVDHFPDEIEPLFKELGFDGLFVPKKDSPCLKSPENNGPDGVALFYRKEKFTLIESLSKCLENLEKQESNQPVLLCILQEKAEKRNICFSVTHFKAKKGFEKLRAVQAKSCLKAVEELQKKVDPESAVVICGDFNGVPSEKFYEIMEQSNDGFLQSAYKMKDGTEPTYTTWKIRQDVEVKHTIDYIWFSHKILDVVSYLELPKESDVPDARFPSYTCPSDHLALCCEFVFKE